MSPMLIVNLTNTRCFAQHCSLFFCKCFLGVCRFYNVAIIVTHQVILYPNFNHPWQYFITSCWQENIGFWAMDEVIHHRWQYLPPFQKQCHLKKYHSDHVTLNIIIISVQTCHASSIYKQTISCLPVLD